MGVEVRSSISRPDVDRQLSRKIPAWAVYPTRLTCENNRRSINLYKAAKSIHFK